MGHRMDRGMFLYGGKGGACLTCGVYDGRTCPLEAPGEDIHHNDHIPAK